MKNILILIISLSSLLFSGTINITDSGGSTTSIDLNKIDKITFKTSSSNNPEMVFVEGGTFVMGDHHDNMSWCLPLHDVTVSDFYIGKYEVTQIEYETIIGNNPSFHIGENLPVEQLSWINAAQYCNALSIKEGLTPCYDDTDWSCNFAANGYRLATEAEWEYAARGGIHHADDFRFSGCHEPDDLTNYAWYEGNSGYESHEVGEKLPNQLNIYDMSGNVWEWCNDWNSTYTTTSQTNPQGPSTGSERVNRGACWINIPDHNRLANRGSGAPTAISGLRGFRIVRASL